MELLSGWQQQRCHLVNSWIQRKMVAKEKGDGHELDGCLDGSGAADNGLRGGLNRMRVFLVAKWREAFVTFEQLQESVLNWGKLLIASGGSYKPPKCFYFYHLISFYFKQDGKWFYEENHTKPQLEMVVPMPDGSPAVINHLPITEAKEPLGVFPSPDGSSKGAIVAMQEKAQEWVDKAQED